MTIDASGYLTLGVVPVGAGPEQGQQTALRGAGLHALGDAVRDVYNDPVVVGYDPATNTWAGPQDALIDFPPTAAANRLALQYAAPGSADVRGLPGRPVPYSPPPIALADGSAPSLGR